MKLTHEQRLMIKDALRANDMTIARFCRIAQIPYSSFYEWMSGKQTGDKHNRHHKYKDMVAKILEVKL